MWWVLKRSSSPPALGCGVGWHYREGDGDYCIFFIPQHPGRERKPRGNEEKIGIGTEGVGAARNNSARRLKPAS